ncbi:uncharacterized protein At4g15970-like isoform X2 [Panicum hallii]|uniref:uncharacterized protein At4g15970-like isoform X2 n=1 Tax=Panicum hallii TaxID=206008 RepID=UPI000DF4CEA4|nr:uncharacterized protein At4g15970-like isoform X2 [Panicum hallii]
MIRPQAGLLLRSLGAGGARPAAMRSATSLLLGAALATAFFLLYTSLCRDLGDSPGSPPRWEQRAREAGAAGGGGGGGQGAALLNPSKQRQDAASKEQEEGRKEVVTRGDGDGGHGARKDQGKGSGTTDNKQQQPQIVMPGTSTSTKQQEQQSQDDLADLLRRAATADKTVLMTAINEAWAAPGSFLDLFLESFRHGEGTADLPRHLLIVAMDGKAFRRCLAVHPFCYWFRVAGMDFAGEQKYMKGDYLEMMWRRNRLQQRVLELGYSFLFTDVDILWFRPPFPRLPAGAQVVMSSDFFVGDPSSPGNYPNGGLLYVQSSPAAVAFYEHWQASRARFPGKHEQYVFDMIVKEGVPASIGAAVRFLDTAVFGGFCQHGKDLGRVATMHANCCVGLENKLFDLRNVLQDWKAYRARVAAGGDARGFSWRVPGRCIH